MQSTDALRPVQPASRSGHKIRGGAERSGSVEGGNGKEFPALAVPWVDQAGHQAVCPDPADPLAILRDDEFAGTL